MKQCFNFEVMALIIISLRIFKKFNKKRETFFRPKTLSMPIKSFKPINFQIKQATIEVCWI